MFILLYWGSVCLSGGISVKKEPHLFCKAWKAGAAKLDLGKKERKKKTYCFSVQLSCWPCVSGGCLANPVWHFAGHLCLKSSQLVCSESSDTTGEPASS